MKVNNSTCMLLLGLVLASATPALGAQMQAIGESDRMTLLFRKAPAES